MLNKLKVFFKRNIKVFVTAMAVAMLAVFSSISCFAVDQSLSDAFSGALTTLQTDLTSYLGMIIPVALGIVASYLCIKKAINWLKGMIGKS